jgi:regulation of enolase protein 1 (concanavalin A-like superfamily)
MRVSLLGFSAAFALGFSAGCTNDPFIPPPGEVVFRDDFGGQLEPGWTFAGADHSKVILNARPGFLLVYPQDVAAPATQASQLLREFTGDFIVTTRIAFQTLVDLEIAGLLVQAQDGRTVALGVLSASGIRGTFRGILLRADRGTDFGRATASTAAEDLYLRLERRGSSFIGSYSTDGRSFILLGTVSNDLPQEALLGIGVGRSDLCSLNCDEEVPAEFDFFELAEPE